MTTARFSRFTRSRRRLAGLAIVPMLLAGLGGVSAAPALAAPAPGSIPGNIPDSPSAPSDPLPVTPPPAVAPEGTIRHDFTRRGDREVSLSLDTRDCDSLVYSVYNEVLRDKHAIESLPECHGTFPGGTLSPVGVQYYWPTDLGSGADGADGKAPLILLSPGIGTEPGMLRRQAEMFASNGYVVAVGYSFFNWFGHQLELAAMGAVDQANDPGSPLHDGIDFGRVIVAGHSAGGGSAIRIGGTLDGTMARYGADGFTTRGIAAIMPGPSDLGYLSPPAQIPLLVAAAENDAEIPRDSTFAQYERHAGPAWWTIVDGTYHGSILDEPSRNAFGALVLSFADYVTSPDEAGTGGPGDPGRTARAAAVYEGPDYRLATDPELSGTQRK